MFVRSGKVKVICRLLKRFFAGPPTVASGPSAKIYLVIHDFGALESRGACRGNPFLREVTAGKIHFVDEKSKWH